MEQVLSVGSQSKTHILKSIHDAGISIKIAMAFFTDKEIANSLLIAKERGVEVQLVLSADGNNEPVKNMLSSKCLVYTHSPNTRGIMHHKFCIIDQKILLHGSYNYTYNASIHNSETLNITNSTNLISEYLIIFNNLIKDAELISGHGNFSETFIPKDDPTYLDKFTNELKNHITAGFDDLTHSEIVQEGKKLSEESDGQENVFIAYLDSTLAKFQNKLNQDSQTRTIVKTRMAASLDRATGSTTKDFEAEVNRLSIFCTNKKASFQSLIDITRERRKNKTEELNKIRTEFIKNKSQATSHTDEMEHLEQKMVVLKFSSLSNFIKVGLLLFFIGYLSLFFGSAIWKVFFEKTEIINSLSRGIMPETPPLFDADAIYKTFSKKGFFYGMIAAFFFIVPVCVSSIKLLLSEKNKWIEILFGWVVGIFIIDVVVSTLISQHTFEIKRLLSGSSETWSLLYALKSAEFWLIFIFGSLPLFLTKFTIEKIWNAYHKSIPESVDRERYFQIGSLKRKIIEKQNEIDTHQSGLKLIEVEVEDFNKTLEKYEDEKNAVDTYENNKKLELTERYQKKNKNMHEIYNSFISSVDSGNKLFLENIVSERITAFKQGFFLHLTSYFSQTESHRRISILETAHQNWAKQNFE